MLDPKFIRSNPEKIKTALINRGADIALLEDFLAVDAKWREKQPLTNP